MPTFFEGVLGQWLQECSLMQLPIVSNGFHLGSKWWRAPWLVHLHSFQTCSHQWKSHLQKSLGSSTLKSDLQSKSPSFIVRRTLKSSNRRPCVSWTTKSKKLPVCSLVKLNCYQVSERFFLQSFICSLCIDDQQKAEQSKDTWNRTDIWSYWWLLLQCTTKALHSLGRS